MWDGREHVRDINSKWYIFGVKVRLNRSVDGGVEELLWSKLDLGFAHVFVLWLNYFDFLA